MVTIGASPQGSEGGRAALSRRAWTILAAGCLVREIVSFWTGHPYDFEAWVRTGYVVAGGHDPYGGTWPPVAGTSFAYLSSNLPAAGYPPFWPELLGGIYHGWQVFGLGNRFVLYLLLKQPGIVADLATGYLLYQLVRREAHDETPAVAVLSFWSFFPYAILITAVWGQFDSLVVVILLALLYARTSLERSVLYGVGIFVKWLTVIFVPLEIFRTRGSRRAVALLAIGLPAGLSAFAFLLEGWSLGDVGNLALYQGHGNGQGMNFAYILTFRPVAAVLSGTPYLYAAGGFVWLGGAVVAGWIASAWTREGGPAAELRAMLLVVTVFLLLRWGLAEQYFLYLFSLVALDVALYHPGRRRLLLFTSAVTTIDLLVNNDLGIRFLSPLFPDLTPYMAAVDHNGSWGFFREYALLALAVLVTVTLLQWIRTVHRDAAAPRPWLFAIARPWTQRRAPPGPGGPPR